MDLSDKFRGCLLGLAVGDAIGTTVEFKLRGDFEPVMDMVGGGPFGLEPGEWTDDTSMALCLATSLLEKGGFDPVDQINRYCNWMDYGYLSSNGRCFDIGMTVREALFLYQATGDPISGSVDPMSAGNGSIMRLAPVPLFYFPDRELAVRYAAESSRITHGAAECLDACRLLANLICRALVATGKDETLDVGDAGFLATESIKAVASGRYKEKTEPQIRGSGYVVHSLEAALWCFATTESYQEAVLKAVNLGDDADTTGAVCGQIAGSFYGESAIPGHWLERLVMRDEIGDLADRLLEAGGSYRSAET